jgi:hypothetical protein
VRMRAVVETVVLRARTAWAVLAVAQVLSEGWLNHQSFR